MLATGAAIVGTIPGCSVWGVGMGPVVGTSGSAFTIGMGPPIGTTGIGAGETKGVGAGTGVNGITGPVGWIVKTLPVGDGGIAIVGVGGAGPGPGVGARGMMGADTGTAGTGARLAIGLDRDTGAAGTGARGIVDGWTLIVGLGAVGDVAGADDGVEAADALWCIT